MPRLHLGINTCFAVKRWPEPEQWLNIVKNELGLNYCQFSLDLVDPLLDEAATASYADAVRELAAAYGVMVHTALTGLAASSWTQLLRPNDDLWMAGTRWHRHGSG